MKSEKVSGGVAVHLRVENEEDAGRRDKRVEEAFRAKGAAIVETPGQVRA